MQHVKLARDRRKRKSRIKAAIFFVALALIFSGVMLGLKDSAESEPSVQSNLEPEIVDDVQYQPLKPEENLHTPPVSEQSHTEDATSYDDELQAQDDEAEEVKPEFDELNDLPQDAQDALSGLLDVADQALRITHQFSHTVVRGDTLKDVLEFSGLEDDTAKGLIASYPELKNLQAGQQFYWILDKNDQLEYLNWLVSEKEERIYERVEEGKFKRQILEKQSVWKKEVLKGKVSGSFAASLRSLGLEARQISQLSSALQWQVSLRKLKKDTKFSVLVSREYLGDKLTGQGNVEAIHILADGKSYYAIQAANGRYYNQQGETLGKGFARYPLQRQARVSSGFNPNRRHPVTGRVRPHKGVDFSVPQGTPVIAPADALVEKVAYQAGGAGRYVVLRHGREYQTIYMHLSRPLVRAGQTVKKGERIALSGNTGISTGPHLHYEFHINGRAVNPLSVKLPGTSSMATAERKQFLRRAKEAERMLKL
ncbi:murein DD-endopeptidase MepM [Rodentibacter pneumotropicus]|uniref:Metalloprotease n=1 Tax=Rodentibacter pneumotropicus TaxID=758 RepID=A0A3S4Y0M1_9PAST|nr:murein DD-endopeptidase MepM [Rodentibacter pneumotropicus]NBH74489.1 murein DD-endopeptidase MepM [Rodentibacter pneumotropicus]OOF62568.1 peptidase M23 [Rodentibacter pneumotropicus]THA04424.1 murein DD-endopeptidase MepM [Rodentibacter pneumotropicus]THA05458.1 murein DD-endopeptidase MepM [Rodentibacter pneumotropicus]THA07945.1 murein DD-endopeptidase MepM [Rodentibacter pneumotropicus]